MSVFKEKTVVLEMSHDQKLLTLRATSQTKNELNSLLTIFSAVFFFESMNAKKNDLYSKKNFKFSDNVNGLKTLFVFKKNLLLNLFAYRVKWLPVLY